MPASVAEHASAHAPAQATDQANSSSSSDALMQALCLAIQHTTSNDFLDSATFARLCVSKTLQTALESAAVGCLSVDLPLSTSGSPAQFIREPYRQGPVSQQQLAWVAKHLQQGHIRQLRLTGLSARSIRRYGTGVYAIMPALEQVWGDIRSQHSACIQGDPAAACSDNIFGGFYTLCGVLVDVKPASTPAQPQVSPTLTQLTLGIEEYTTGSGWHAPEGSKQLWQAALQQLPQLTSLQELALPVFNPPTGALAPALYRLTSLTKLFIRHPLPPEQKALPVSLKHLTAARAFEYSHADWPSRLPPLQLTHLTALDTLEIHEEHWAGSEASTQMLSDSYIMCEGVPAGSALPVNLQHLVVKGIRHVQPMLVLTQLKTLTMTNGRFGLSHAQHAPDVADLVALTQLTSLTRVAIQGRRPTQEQLQHGLQALFDALPIDLTGLDPEPGGAAGGAQGRHGRMGFSVGLGSIVLRGSRGCSMWTGVRALMDMLMDRNI